MTKIELDNYTIHNLEQKNPTICCKQGQKRSSVMGFMYVNVFNSRI